MREIARRLLTRQHRPQAQILTKGDNNNADDTDLYAHGQDYLERQDIIGSGTCLTTRARMIRAHGRATANLRSPSGRLYSVCGLRDDPSERIPLVENGHAGHNGFGRDITEGIIAALSAVEDRHECQMIPVNCNLILSTTC